VACSPSCSHLLPCNFAHQGGGGNVPALRHDKPRTFFTVGLGWLRLGVKPWMTLAASLVALFSVTITVGGAMANGHLFGDALANLAGGVIVTARRWAYLAQRRSRLAMAAT